MKLGCLRQDLSGCGAFQESACLMKLPGDEGIKGDVESQKQNPNEGQKAAWGVQQLG